VEDTLVQVKHAGNIFIPNYIITGVYKLHYLPWKLFIRK